MEKETASKGSGYLKKILNKQEFSVFILIIIMGLFAWTVSPSFLSWGNLASILRAMSFMSIVALGMTFVFIAGELDLSIGSVVAFSGMIMGDLVLNRGVSTGVAITCGILTGLICGLITGFITVQFNIPAMIGSLGTQFIIRGIVFVYTSGNPISPLPKGIETLGLGNIAGIPTPTVVLLVLSIIFAFLLHKTTYGRKIYAIGGNKDTAWLCGINVKMTRISAYCLTGIMAGVAGVLLTSRLSSAQPNSGTGWEMNVIASVVVGGTSTSGGVGTIAGTVLGSILIGMLQNVLVMLKVSAYWQNIVIGTIILISVIFDQYRKHSAGAKMQRAVRKKKVAK